MKKLLLGLMFWMTFGICAQPLPLNDFVKFGDYLDIQISPDGKHLLARLRTDNRVVLVVIRALDGEIVGGVTPNNNDIIHTANWVNNERFVYEFAEKQTYLDAPIPQGELFASNIDGKLGKVLYGFRASDEKVGSRISSAENTRASQDILSILEDDDDHILIIEYPWSKDGQWWYDNRTKQPDISKLNVYTGRKKKLETLPYGRSSAVADKNGEVKFMRWKDEQNVSHAAYRANAEQAWQSLAEAFNITENLIPFALSNDGNFAYFVGNNGDKAIQTVFELNLNTKAYKTIFDGMQADISQWVLDAKTNAPVLGVSYPNKHQYHYTDVASQTAEVHKMLAEAFDGQEVIIEGSSKDGNYSLFSVRSDINPGEYYVFDYKNKDAKFLWANRSWIDPQQMHKMQTIQFTASDGVTINGYLTQPANPKSQTKTPLVVVLHGGPRARDYWGYDNEVQMLANNGFAVLQVNFRGSDGYGDDFVNMGNKLWGSRVIEDVLEGTQWAIDNASVDGQKISVYGGSVGGYAALMATARKPQMYKCAIGYAGVYDLNYMFTESDISDNWGGPAYLEEALGHDKQQLNEFSPINHADKISAAVMLIHGEKDRRVPIVNAQKMAEKLKALGKNVSTLSFGLSAHGVYEEKSRLKLYEDLIKFLNKHIAPATH